MNIFRLLGDLSHLASFLFLIQRLLQRKTTLGLSLKTQELFLVVFVARYLDLFTNFISLYNSVMKMVYIGCSAYIVYLFRYKEPYKTTYEEAHDTYLHVKYAIVPAAVLGLVVHEGYSHWHGFTLGSISHFMFEQIWAFSIYLECIAILPQLILLQRHRCVENLTSWYMFSLGAYRGFYILNWIYRWAHNEHISAVAFIAGLIQTAFYVDFFYHFVKSKASGHKVVVLPS